MSLSLGGFSGRAGGNALYIAASNCPARLKAGADFVCPGTGDDVKINEALAHGPVVLSPGSFYINSPIVLSDPGQAIEGAGMGPGGTYLVSFGSGAVGHARLSDVIQIKSDHPDSMWCRVRGMYINGNRDNKTRTVSGTIDSVSGLTIGDSTMTSMTVNEFAGIVGVRVVKADGSAEQYKLIASNAAKTITIRDSWLWTPSNGDTFEIRGAGIAIYGDGSGDGFDFNLWDMAVMHAHGHCVHTDQTWGGIWSRLVLEYAGWNGVNIGAEATGLKICESKIVWNELHGIRLVDNCYRCIFALNELAGGVSGDGIHIPDGASGHLVECNVFQSHHGSGARSGVYLAGVDNVIKGNVFASSATNRCAELVSAPSTGQRNIIEGNKFLPYTGDLAIGNGAGSAGDASGRNLIANNEGFNTDARMSLVLICDHGDPDRVTLTPDIVASMTARQLAIVVSPNDTAARAAGVPSASFNAGTLTLDFADALNSDAVADTVDVAAVNSTYFQITTHNGVDSFLAGDVGRYIRVAGLTVDGVTVGWRIRSRTNADTITVYLDGDTPDSYAVSDAAATLHTGIKYSIAMEWHNREAAITRNGIAGG